MAEYDTSNNPIRFFLSELIENIKDFSSFAFQGMCTIVAGFLGLVVTGIGIIIWILVAVIGVVVAVAVVKWAFEELAR